MQQMERNRLATADAAIVDSFHTILATLMSELRETRRRIKALINDTPYQKERRDLLESIPGNGPAASAYPLVALSDHYAFASAKQAVAYAGLATKLQESVQWVGKTRLTKTDDPALRKALYMPAPGRMAIQPHDSHVLSALES